MSRNWTIHVIHHSHTDIGYTDRQERVAQYHVDFIRQAMAILKSGVQGFRWTCETFWAVEQFFAEATELERVQFLQAVRTNQIGLSASYLNLSELAGRPLFETTVQRFVEFCRNNDLKCQSAMTADVNGFTWGWAQAWADAGIVNYLSCVHTHHGTFPAFRKQFPFFWELPSGKKLLVWNGEHYHLGNELGFCPNAFLSYTFRDEFEGIKHPAETVSQIRVKRYLEQLEAEGYPYDFVPITVHGLPTDNGPPNSGIADFIRGWNEAGNGNVKLKMSTLDSFFDHVRQDTASIPTYRGDWPDWWTDGCSSMPQSLAQFLRAQRVWESLKADGPYADAKVTQYLADAAEQLILYTEHTYGLFSSVKEPHSSFGFELQSRKAGQASEASRLVGMASDRLAWLAGETLLSSDRPMTFRIENRGDASADAAVLLQLEHWETPPRGFRWQAFDGLSATPLPCQATAGHRGDAVMVQLTIEPGKARFVSLGPTPTVPRVTSSPSEAADRQDDLATESSGWSLESTRLQTPDLTLEWSPDRGLLRWLDRRTQTEWIAAGDQPGFLVPLAERTPPGRGEDQESVRSKMGRNRKGAEVQRAQGRLTAIKTKAEGAVFVELEFHYELPGFEGFLVALRVPVRGSRVEFCVRFRKSLVWDPENLYLSLPVDRSSAALWVGRAGLSVRPSIDQIPGSLTDFLAVSEGAVFLGEKGSLLVGLPETPLLQTGPLDFGRRRLQPFPTEPPLSPSPLYVWVLNNFWETNFKATTEGFHEYRIWVESGSFASPEQALARCRANNLGPRVLRG